MSLKHQIHKQCIGVIQTKLLSIKKENWKKTRMVASNTTDGILPNGFSNNMMNMKLTEQMHDTCLGLIPLSTCTKLHFKLQPKIESELG